MNDLDVVFQGTDTDHVNVVISQGQIV